MKPSTQKVFFIHGGPGFNSIAEEEILGPRLKNDQVETYFFNEKSPQSFTDLCNQIETAFVSLAWERVHVIAHSFAIFPVFHLLRCQPGRIKELTLIAPPLDLQSAYRNILNLARRDFIATDLNHPLADELTQFLAQNKTVYDLAMQKGLAIAVQDPKLFNHYWANKERQAEYFSIWATHAKSVDMKSLHLVLNEFEKELLKLGNENWVSTNIVYGSNDPVTNVSEQSALLKKFFPNSRELAFERSAHFPHLEEIDQFLPLVTKM